MTALFIKQFREQFRIILNSKRKAFLEVNDNFNISSHKNRNVLSPYRWFDINKIFEEQEMLKAKGLPLIPMSELSFLDNKEKNDRATRKKKFVL